MFKFNKYIKTSNLLKISNYCSSLSVLSNLINNVCDMTYITDYPNDNLMEYTNFIAGDVYNHLTITLPGNFISLPLDFKSRMINKKRERKLEDLQH